MPPIIVGKLGKPFGVKGWLKLYSYTEPTANILHYQPWLVRQQGQWQYLSLEDAQQQGTAIVVKLPQIASPEQAALWTNSEVGIERDQLPPLVKGEYYWSDFEGLTVLTTHGETLGRVQRLFSTGANDVLVVKGSLEHLIPYVPEHIIKHIDLSKRHIIVDWEVI